MPARLSSLILARNLWGGSWGKETTELDRGSLGKWFRSSWERAAQGKGIGNQEMDWNFRPVRDVQLKGYSVRALRFPKAQRWRKRPSRCPYRLARMGKGLFRAYLFCRLIELLLTEEQQLDDKETLSHQSASTSTKPAKSAYDIMMRTSQNGVGRGEAVRQSTRYPLILQASWLFGR